MILIGSGFIPVSLSGSALLLVVPLMVLAALMLDRLLAEPARCHPLVAFGRWAAWLEVRLNSPHPARSRLAGWLAMLLALTPWCVVVLLMYLAAAQLWLWLILNVLVLYSCIGWQSLQRHVVAVASASDSEQARARLGLIVPPTNTVNETEWRAMLPAGVSFHTHRMRLHPEMLLVHELPYRYVRWHPFLYILPMHLQNIGTVDCCLHRIQY